MQKPSKKVQNRPYFSLRFFARVRHITAYNFWTDSHFFIILLASVVTVLNFADKYETGFFILVLIFLAKLKHKCQNLFRSIVISKACFQHFDPWQHPQAWTHLSWNVERAHVLSMHVVPHVVLTRDPFSCDPGTLEDGGVSLYLGVWALYVGVVAWRKRDRGWEIEVTKTHTISQKFT